MGNLVVHEDEIHRASEQSRNWGWRASPEFAIG